MKNTSCVILGAWNTAIVNPNWIAREVMGKKENETFPVEVALGASTTMKAEIDGLIFIPTSTQLVIYPSKEQDDLFALVDESLQKIYEKLSYTPITAIGHNFSYLLNENENFIEDIDLETVDFEKVYKDIGIKKVENVFYQQAIRIENDENVLLNISYKNTSGGKILGLNYHYQIDNRKSVITHSISNFLKNFQHAKKIAKKLIRSGN